MPITNMSNITPLSRDWTHEDIFSEAMILCNQHDNEKINLDNVRHHLNLSLSYIASLANAHNRPWYGTFCSGALESAQHESGLDYVDLSVTFGIIIPANSLSDIKRVSLKGTPATSTDWIGNLKKMDIAELTNQLNQLNTHHRHTIAWCHHGSDLLVYTGSKVSSTANVKTSPDYDISSQTIILFAYRKPNLDNMYAPNDNDANNNYRSKIDLPDDLVYLAIKMVQQNILSQVMEQIPAQLSQEINQGLAEITQTVGQEYQFEALEREKAKYGKSQLPAGGGA